MNPNDVSRHGPSSGPAIDDRQVRGLPWRPETNEEVELVHSSPILYASVHAGMDARAIIVALARDNERLRKSLCRALETDTAPRTIVFDH